MAAMKTAMTSTLNSQGWGECGTVGTLARQELYQ
jgi:hypothetical protein